MLRSPPVFFSIFQGQHLLLTYLLSTCFQSDQTANLAFSFQLKKKYFLFSQHRKTYCQQLSRFFYRFHDRVHIFFRSSVGQNKVQPYQRLHRATVNQSVSQPFGKSRKYSNVFLAKRDEIKLELLLLHKPSVFQVKSLAQLVTPLN